MKNQLFLILTVLSFNSSAQVPSYVDTVGLVAWYSFTGNAIDSSGHGYNGAVHGATLTTDRFGHANSAYYFHGDTDYISTMAAFTQSDSDKSYSVWFKADTIKRGWILAGGTDASSQDFGLFMQDNLGEILFNGFGTYDEYIDTVLDTSTWHNIVTTYSADIVRSYIDGVLHGVFSDALNTAYSGIVFGRRQNPALESGHDAYFQGTIDDIGIWSRALNDTEITALYTGTDTAHTSLSVKAIQENTINVYPNPTNNIVNVSGSMVIEKAEIINLLGQTVKVEQSTKNTLQIDLSGLSNGMYILKVNDTYFNKIVKQ